MPILYYTVATPIKQFTSRANWNSGTKHCKIYIWNFIDKS